MIIKFKKDGFMARRVMPLARAIENNKLKAFLAMYAIWLVDLASTAIALGLFSNNLQEANPIAASFFNAGLIGWIGWMFVCAGLIAGLLYLPNIFLKIDTWIYGKRMKGRKLKNNKNTYTLLRLMNVSFIILIEIIVIINNLRLLFGEILI